MKFNIETIATLGQQATGSILLASGSISSPVEFLDLALPTGYVSFAIQLMDFAVSAPGDGVAIAASVDGGVAFVCDSTNFDSYYQVSQTTYGLVGDGNNQYLNAALDSLLDVPLTGVVIDSNDLINITINPGGSPSHFTLNVSATVTASNRQTLYQSIGGATFNPLATVVPPTERVNLIRLLPYGNGDVNPPTSGETITAGTYFLWGVPTPE